MEVNDLTKQLEQVDWHEETDRRHPATLIPALETISNSFSFRPKELVEAVNANPSAAYNFAILSCACAISMAYTYLCDEKRGGHWDARNLASQRYFYEHFDALKEAFDKLAGFPMPFKEEPRFQYFQDDCRLPRKERLYQEYVRLTACIIPCSRVWPVRSLLRLLRQYQKAVYRQTKASRLFRRSL